MCLFTEKRILQVQINPMDKRFAYKSIAIFCRHGQASLNAENSKYEFMNNLLVINTFFFLAI